MAMSVAFTNFGGRVVHENRGGVERDYVRDPLGNTVALVDMNGNVTDTYSYWPYGELRTHTGSSTTPFTFLGTLGYFNDFGNQFYVRARHYRADLTAWITTDPLWPDELSYAYTYADPINWVDPSGLACSGSDTGNPVSQHNLDVWNSISPCINKAISSHGNCRKALDLPPGMRST